MVTTEQAAAALLAYDTELRGKLGTAPQRVLAMQAALSAHQAAAQPVGAVKRRCEAVQCNDEMRCARCGFVWDVSDEDPPTCRSVRL